MLHAKDGARLKQQYICTKDGEIVPRDQMVKGYEFSKDQYVTFTPEELKALEEQSTQSIEIVEFVPITKVDPVYFERTYYLGPDKGGAKAYALLAEAMKETGRVALARYAARGKQYLVMLRPFENGIVMQQLLYADEVRSFSEVPLEPAEVSPKELELAKLLVEQRAANDFKPETYEDDVKKRVLGLIQQKVEGQEISIVPPRPRRRPDHRPDGGPEGEPREEARGRKAAPEAKKAASGEGRPRGSRPSARRDASPRCGRPRGKLSAISHQRSAGRERG